jgi:hypothetical protein
MEYGLSKRKLPKGYSYPLKRSVLDSFLESANLRKLDTVTYSFYAHRDNIIIRADYFGEAHKGWAGVGLSSIVLQAVPSAERKEVENVLIEKVLPELCSWLRSAEEEGNAWRAWSRHLFYRHSNGHLFKSEF